MDANTFGLMSAGFANALMPSNLIMMIIGVTIGIVVGCMPGLSAAMGVALLLPLTFGMAPETGLIMLGGIYCGAIFGGSISAILIHTPARPLPRQRRSTGMNLPNREKPARHSARHASLPSSADSFPVFPFTSLPPCLPNSP